MHISDLKRKDYSSHKIQEIGLNNWLEKDLTKVKIMTVMFLQTEGIFYDMMFSRDQNRINPLLSQSKIK